MQITQQQRHWKSPQTSHRHFVPERASDLAADPNGLIYATTQAGSIVYQWDPATENREEIRNRFPDVVAITFSEDAALFTTTDHGVTGTLASARTMISP